MFQLVGDGVRVFNPRDDGTWYDAEGVREKFGVPPERVVDVLALMGDPVDNIKGVPGIGDKGARELITAFGSLDGLLERAGEVTQKKYREALLAGADLARQSRELASIRRDVPVAFDVEALRYRGPKREACYELFGELGFRSLTSEFAPAAETTSADYAIVETIEAVRALAAELRAARRFVAEDHQHHGARGAGRARRHRRVGRKPAGALHSAGPPRAGRGTSARPSRNRRGAEGGARGPGGREGRPRPEA